LRKYWEIDQIVLCDNLIGMLDEQYSQQPHWINFLFF